MPFVLVGAVVTFAVVLALIVRELRRPARATAPARGNVARLVATEDFALDVTRVGHRPKAPAPAPVNIPILSGSEEDIERSPTTQSAVTLYEGDAELDEPTGPHELIVVHAVAQTDPGKRRARNEDSFLAMPEQGLFVVADGMGGYAGGDVASRLAVHTIQDTLGNRTGVPDPHRPLRGNELVWAMEAANEAVFTKAHQDETLEGMGTTLVAARFSPRKQRVFIGNVGDSRCYRKRDGKLTQLTTDHTMASLGVTGPYASHLRRAVGVKKRVNVDLVIDTPRPGDVYLLCSDGLSKMVPDALIDRVIEPGADVQARAAELVALANERGGKDNITVILMAVLPPTEGQYRKARARL